MAKAELPLAFISIAIGPFVLTVTMSFVLDPLADIAVPSNTLPDTVSILYSIGPFAIVCVPGHPSVQAFSTDRALMILSQILVPITKALVAFTMAFIVDPFTFVYSTDFIYADTLAVAVAINKLTAV